MTAYEFVEKLQAFYERKYNETHLEAIYRKLLNLHENRLDLVYGILIEQSRYLPKLYELVEALEEAGSSKRKANSPESKSYNWNQVGVENPICLDCQCAGTGYVITERSGYQFINRCGCIRGREAPLHDEIRTLPVTPF